MWAHKYNLDSVASVSKIINLDAAESRFLIRELVEVETTVLEQQRGPLLADRLIPSVQIPRGVNTWAIRLWDGVGMARLMASKADDMSYVETFASEQTFRLFDFGLGHHYSLREIEAAVRAGIPLDAEKMAYCMRGHAAAREKFAIEGDARLGVPGFISNPNVATYTPPTGNWGTASPAEVAADVLGAVAEIYANTQRLFSANTIVLPTSLRGFLGSTLFAVGTAPVAQTLMGYLTGALPGVTFEWLDELETAGAGGTRRMIVYEATQNVLRKPVQIDFEALAPEVDGFLIKRPCRSAFGGTAWVYPTAGVYVDGI